MGLDDTALPEKIDVLIVGSGFGGSVVAAELAEAGIEVCVLERGNAYPPGAFPRGPAEFGTNFWDPDAGLHGMFDVWSFDGTEAVVASGLGGGSLIYANVMLRKPQSWFTQPNPDQPGETETWSFDLAALEPHYRAVEEFLRIGPLPHDPSPSDPAYALPKTAAFVGTGRAELAPLAVQFLDATGNPVIGAEIPDRGYPNIFGRPRRTCRLCGECDVGCNEGAKNSMDHTYLSKASHHGARLFTRTEVKTITRNQESGTFEVTVRVYPRADERSRVPAPLEHTITATRVVLAAGALGSSYLMLRNEKALKLDNPALGTRYSGNGDLLGFILGAEQELVGWRGPVITTYLAFPNDSDTGVRTDFGMYIQDAGYPEFASWMVDTWSMLRRWRTILATMVGIPLSRRLRFADTSLSAELTRILGGEKITSRGLPVLGMGMDVPDGTLHVDKKNRLHNTWKKDSSAEYFDILVDRMRQLAADLGGRLSLNPTYRFNRVISVHPLGGCPADTDMTPGVVDTFGRVRGVPGLRICDGSVFPGPIGANPSLTIAAFARRVAHDMRDNECTRPELWPEVAQT